MRTLFPLALAGLTLIGCSQPAVVESVATADESEANTCVQTKVWDTYGDGWGVRTMKSETLKTGGHKSYAMTLFKGNTYRFVGCGDSQVKNLDIYLLDVQNPDFEKPTAKDTTVDREPTFEFTPTQTGSYYIVMFQQETGAAESGSALAVLYK